MSTDLYSITVLALGDEHVDLWVRILHRVEPISSALTFALRLLFDPIEQERVHDAPLAQEIDPQDIFDESFVHANARGFVRAATYLEPVTRGTREGTLRIEVTHPAWIAHLTQGMGWSTTSYGSGDGAPWPGRTRAPGDHVREVSEDPMEGMFTRSRDARMQEFETSLSSFVIPSLGAGHYATREALTGEALTVGALRQLLGQPVLLEVARHGRVVGALIHIVYHGRLTLYHESSDAYGTHQFNLRDLTSAGRAWYVRRVHVDDIGV